MDAEVTQRVRRLARPERHDNHSPCEVLAVVVVDVGDGVRAVRRVAVEDAARVAELAAGDVALRLKADIAIRHQKRDHRAFGKDEIRVADQQLIPHRNLVLAAAKAKLR